MTFRSSMQAAVLVGLVAAAGCTVKNSSSDGGASTCSTDTSVNCMQGSGNGYSCTGSDTPVDEVCSKGTVSSDGTKVQYCCVSSSGVSSSCTADSTVSCAQGTGFSCTGTGTPDQNDTTLVCSSGTVSGSTTDYCCIPYAQSSTTCTQDPTIVGCQSGSLGFSCSGTDTPQQSNSNLNCSTGTASNGKMLFCCS
jgi:hypothetical protein